MCSAFRRGVDRRRRRAEPDALSTSESGAAGGVAHVVGGDDRNAVGFGPIGEPPGEALAVALVMAVDVDGEPLREQPAQAVELRGCVRPGERTVETARETEEPAGMLLELRPGGERLALRASARCVGEQPAEIAVAGALLDQQVHPARALH
jgi:hypothetical protein